MQYRYHSTRCRHGMCLATVGCEACGVEVPEAAGAHLRRADFRGSTATRGANGQGGAGYSESETRGRGNRNAARGG